MTMYPDDSQEAQEEQARPSETRPPKPGPAFAEAEPRVRDLSLEIVKTISKAADERVTCRWISGHNYRCNWWAPQSTASYDNPAMSGLTVTTHRVRRSQWLHVTKTEKGLIIHPPQSALRQTNRA